MKIVMNIVAIFLLVLGTIWFLQGINILPGSFMTGQMPWAIRGGAMIVTALAILYVNRKSSKS